MADRPDANPTQQGAFGDKPLQARQTQAVFEAKVVTDHALAGAPGRCNLVDGGTGEALVSKLAGRHGQDLGHGAARIIGVSTTAGCRLQRVFSMRRLVDFLTHKPPASRCPHRLIPMR